jgi:hypothetical protein
MTGIKAILGVLLAAVLAGAFALASAAGNTASPRSGELHVTKECSQYDGQAGSFCTITSSNIPQITRGMRVVYTSAADLVTLTLNTDIVLDGPGNNDASGHVTLNILTGSGVVTLTGGTGRFSGIHATVAVTYSGGTWHWDGTYSFTPPGQDR